ncbi:MAG TPA: BTAD domain-containing putative transcriptional regulator, partial [Longimicrobium sp.]|nr:BTAD domain-containing putative transcriptional regulator [Longimicrobium sp.]
MFDLRLLGGAGLHDSRGTEVRSVLQQPKRWALLAYLAAARPRGFHRRDTLLALFWAELDEAAARNSLGQAVHFLRRELGAGVLVNRGRSELGLAEGAVRCDAVEFEGEIAAGRPERALALYRGDLLAGFHLAGAPELGQWMDGERARLRALAAGTARRVADERAAAGDPAEACRWMRFATGLDPLDERGVRRLLRLLDAAGDRSAALQAYDDFARRLRDELQAEPGAETRALADELR